MQSASARILKIMLECWGNLLLFHHLWEIPGITAMKMQQLQILITIKSKCNGGMKQKLREKEKKSKMKGEWSKSNVSFRKKFFKCMEKVPSNFVFFPFNFLTLHFSSDMLNHFELKKRKKLWTLRIASSDKHLITSKVSVFSILPLDFFKITYVFSHLLAYFYIWKYFLILHVKT